MQLVGKLIIKSKNKIIEFLNQESTGRIASIDKDRFPQIIPTNFVFLDDLICCFCTIQSFLVILFSNLFE